MPSNGFNSRAASPPNNNICYPPPWDDLFFPPPTPDSAVWPCPGQQTDFLQRILVDADYTVPTPPSPPTLILLGLGGRFSYDAEDAPAEFHVDGVHTATGWIINCNATNYNGGTFSVTNPPFSFFILKCNPFSLHFRFSTIYSPPEPFPENIQVFIDPAV